MANPFKAAKRQGRKLRLALDGPSGSGKTYTALRLAFNMKAAGLCSKIAVIDTENESADLYEKESPDGEPWQFDSMQLKQFSPTQFTWAMNEAVKNGYDCVVIDSLSHAWIGEGGALDQVDKKGGNSFTAWKDITPLQREMVNTIIRLKAHVIVTMRSKTEYVMVEEVNRQGKTVQVPRKIGLAPIQRDGMEYEFDLYGRMDQSNQIQISKSRCSAMSGRTSDKPGPAFWQPLFDWISSAPAAEPAAPAAAVPSVEEIQEAEFQRLLTVIGQANDLDFLALAAETVKANKSKISEEHSKKLREYYAARKDAITKSIQRTAAPAPDAATGEVAAAAS